MKLPLLVVWLDEGLLQPLNVAADFAILWPVEQVFAWHPRSYHAAKAPEAALLASLTAALEPGLVVGENLDDVVRGDHAELHVGVGPVVREVLELLFNKWYY